MVKEQSENKLSHFLRRYWKLLLVLVFLFLIWNFSNLKKSTFYKAKIVASSIGIKVSGRKHVVDEANLFPKSDILKFEQYLEWIFKESDVDIRFIFLQSLGDKTIEEFAVEKVEELQIGGNNREERGVLLLYDLEGKRLRVEVGYGLEEYFTDGFVSYLMHDHTQIFFTSGDLTTGLRLLIRMLHHNIRSAVLENRFDPRIIETIRHRRYLPGGAGVTEAMVVKGEEIESISKKQIERHHQNYLPGPTPRATYEKYIEWLSSGLFDPRIKIFTPQSQNYMASLPITEAYFHYILIQEYGRKYQIEIRDNVALLYFINDPLVSPHFFIKTEKGWQMDIYAEAKNIRNRVGGIYIWDYGGSNDIYTKAFLDKLINIKNYIRLKDGDNRELPTRSS